MPELIAIDVSRFNDDAYIESRVATVPISDRGPLRTALGYLYKDDGPSNLPRDRLLVAQPYLEAAERIVVRWLYTRTNGNLRSTYGAAALHAARASRYRCEVCAFADVRVLNLDHVDGRVAGTPFACLCANCHTIKSRANDWTGRRPQRDPLESQPLPTTASMAASDMNLEREFASQLFDRLRIYLTDVGAVRATVERLKPHAKTFPEVRFCKGCVLPAVSETAKSFLAANFGASNAEIFNSLRCEGYDTLDACYAVTESRPGFCGSAFNRDKQALSKSGGRAGSGASPDFCIWYATRGRLRVAGEIKYAASRRSSRSAVQSVLSDLRYYLSIKSCSHSDWGHDFGFGVAYCAGGKHPRKAELLSDYWESDRIFIAYFSDG